VLKIHDAELHVRTATPGEHHYELSGNRARIDSEACSSAITNDDGSVNGESQPAAISGRAILLTSAAAGIAIGIELHLAWQIWLWLRTGVANVHDGKPTV
jgi:hypothetical protein